MRLQEAIAREIATDAGLDYDIPEVRERVTALAKKVIKTTKRFLDHNGYMVSTLDEDHMP